MVEFKPLLGSAYYENALRPKIEAQLARRRDMRPKLGAVHWPEAFDKVGRFFSGMMIVGFLGVLIGWGMDSVFVGTIFAFMMMVGFAVVMMLVFAGQLWPRGPRLRRGRTLKRMILPEVLVHYGQLEYVPLLSSNHKFAEIRSPLIETSDKYTYIIDDVIEGVFEGVTVQLFATRPNTVATANQIVAKLDLSTFDEEGVIYIVGERLGGMLEDKIHLAKLSRANVRLESQSFLERFSVLATDQVSARRYFTPARIEQWEENYNALGGFQAQFEIGAGYVMVSHWYFGDWLDDAALSQRPIDFAGQVDAITAQLDEIFSILYHLIQMHK